MSDTPENKMCRGKKRYMSEIRAIRATIASSKTFGKALRHYRCPICHGWHVTSRVRD